MLINNKMYDKSFENAVICMERFKMTPYGE